MKNEKRKKIVRTSLLIISGSIFIFSVYNLVLIYFTYLAIDRLNTEIQVTYTTPITSPDSDYTTVEDNGKLAIDWENLLRRNSDVIGWILIPNTNINYPILQGETNQTYLHTNINGDHSIAGSIFMQANNNPLFQDTNTILHGHNMRNNSMFADLNRIARRRIEMPSHVHIYLPDGRLKLYRVASVNQIDINSALYNSSIKTLQDYLELFRQGSVSNINFNRDNIERILTLSTCRGLSSTTPLRTVLYAYLEQEIMLP